jgi:hypothetical protein
MTLGSVTAVTAAPAGGKPDITHRSRAGIVAEGLFEK